MTHLPKYTYISVVMAFAMLISFSKTELSSDITEVASVGGKYMNMIQILNCPSDGAQNGNFNDYGYWGGGAWCGKQGKAGYWVWVAPNWYVWADKEQQVPHKNTCLPSPAVELSERMSKRLKKDDNQQNTFNMLMDEFSRLTDDDRDNEAKEVADALVLISSCLNKSNPIAHADVLAKASFVYELAGNLDRAEEFIASSAAIFDQQPGSGMMLVSQRLSQYAVFLANRGKHEEALIWFNKAEEHAPPQFRDFLRQLKAENLTHKPEMVKQSLGHTTDSPQTKLHKLISKIENLKNERRFAEIAPLVDEAHTIAKRLFGNDSPELAYIEKNLAVFAQLSGDDEKAEKIFSHALHILADMGPLAVSQLETAKMLFASQFLKSRSGKYAEAEKLYREVVEARRQRGEPPWALAGPLGNIAGLRQLQGYPEEAEQLYKEVLATLASSPLGKNNQPYAATLDNLAGLYRSSGRFAEALKLRQESISIFEKLASAKKIPESMDRVYNEKGVSAVVQAKLQLAGSIENLANLYGDLGENENVEKMYRKAITLMEEVSGDVGEVNLISSRNSLAGFLIKGGKFAEARTLLELNMKKLDLYFPSKISPQRLIHLELLGELDMVAGRNESAAEHLDRGMEILNSTISYSSPGAFVAFLNLRGINLINMKQQGAGIKMLIRAMELRIKERDAVMYTLNDREKLNYLFTKAHAPVELLSSLPGSNGEDFSKAFDLWLRWKGGLYETQHLYSNLGNIEVDSETTKLFNRLKEVSRQLARLYLQKNNEENRAKRIPDLEKEKGDIENLLSKSSRQFSRLKRAETMGVTDLKSLFVGQSAYIDVAKLPGYDFKTMKFGPDQYYIFVLNNQKTSFVSLGEAGSIDSYVRQYQAEIRRAAVIGIAPRVEELKRLSRSIYSLVIAPIKQHLPADGDLYISPDGDLNLIPFEILEDSEGKQILDRYSVSYATTGPDLIRSTSSDVTKSTGATLIADPDYDGGTTAIASKSATTVSRDLRSLHFERLPETATEIRIISGVLAKSGISSHALTGQQANDESIYALNAPRILHIATHGFFLKSSAGRPKMGQLSRSGELFTGESPLVRSGLALAGANLSLKEGSDTGLATVGKLIGLRLAGTDLVVLSACNTGVGDIEAGEGVFGLKRAISLAGARSIMTSLWSVPNNETVQLMTTFYTLWQGGKTKAKALQEAKLSLRSINSNPFFWGAFTLSGSRE